MQLRSEKGGNYAGEYHYEPDEVAMSEWRMTKGRLFTKHAWPCIALAAINTSNRIGILGHFTRTSESHGDRDIFESAIEALPELGPSSNTFIRLAGGSILDEEGTLSETVLESRRFAQETTSTKAAEMGVWPHNLAISWLAGGGVVANVTLDCSLHQPTIIVEERLVYGPF